MNSGDVPYWCADLASSGSPFSSSSLAALAALPPFAASFAPDSLISSSCSRSLRRSLTSCCRSARSSAFRTSVPNSLLTLARDAQVRPALPSVMFASPRAPEFQTKRPHRQRGSSQSLPLLWPPPRRQASLFDRSSSVSPQHQPLLASAVRRFLQGQCGGRQRHDRMRRGQCRKHRRLQDARGH